MAVTWATFLLRLKDKEIFDFVNLDKNVCKSFLSSEKREINCVLMTRCQKKDSH